jgi:hypothetical protein
MIPSFGQLEPWERAAGAKLADWKGPTEKRGHEIEKRVELSQVT